MNRRNLSFHLIILSILFFMFNCNSFQVIQEPNLERISVNSETICTEFVWYAPFCTKGKSNSIMIKGIYNNVTGEKKYYLEYYLDLLDTDLPVGISLYLDGTYYNLEKKSTDYTEILNVESELSSEVISKINSAKKNIGISYSNRKDTSNFTLSDGESKNFTSQLNEVVKKINSLDKLKIVK